MAKKFKTLEQFKKDTEIGGSQKKLQDIMKVYAFPQPDAPENTFVKGKHYGFPLQGKKSLPYRSKGYNTDKPFGDLGTPSIDFSKNSKFDGYEVSYLD
jgi:hypothetical protein